MNNNKIQLKTGSAKPVIQTRHIMLQPHYRKNTWGQIKVTSKLLLCGNWLEQAGFFADDYVTVKVKNKKLVISLSATVPGEEKI